MMRLSFFGGLNPFSIYSGISYRVFLPNNYLAVYDDNIIKGISTAWYKCNYISEALFFTYRLIIGVHYNFIFIIGSVGLKGILDFLVLPLVMRKLFLYSINLDKVEFNSVSFFKFLIFCIVALFELIRTLIGIILTLFLSPIVIILHNVKMTFFYNEVGEVLTEAEATINSVLAAITVTDSNTNTQPLTEAVMIRSSDF